MNELQRITRIALLTALSLILFILEGFLPLPLPVPGAKLGLAAIVTLIALYLLPARDAALMLTLRIILASVFGGGLAPMIYSLAGGAASFAAMVLLKRYTQLSIVGISAAGGFTIWRSCLSPPQSWKPQHSSSMRPCLASSAYSQAYSLASPHAEFYRKYQDKYSHFHFFVLYCH